MKNLPGIDIDYSELYRSLYAPIRSKLLLTGIELKVFDELSEPASAEAVAQAITGHAENTRIFLDALVAADILQKKKGLYKNTPVAQAFLMDGSSTYLGTLFTGLSQRMLGGLDDLSALIKKGSGPSPEDADMGSGEMWAQFAGPMANYARAGRAQQVAEIISNLPEFSFFGKMLDLGGGPGIHGIAIILAHPDMKGVIFDRPVMVKAAKTFIEEYQLEDRMDVIGGDFVYDSIGEGYDLILASATLNMCKDDLDMLMQKIHSALNPGGVFVSLHDGLTGEGTQPGEMILPTISYALMGLDTRFDQGFIADTMLRTGFQSVHSRALDTPEGPMDLDIGRKAT